MNESGSLLEAEEYLFTLILNQRLVWHKTVLRLLPHFPKHLLCIPVKDLLLILSG